MDRAKVPCNFIKKNYSIIYEKIKKRLKPENI